VQVKESSFWTGRLRDHLAGACQVLGWRYHLERVENAVAAGTPDVDWCINGVEGTMELKYSPRHPVRPATPVLGRDNGMRRSQVVWAVRRLRAGGRVFVAIGTPQATWVVDLRGWSPEAMASLELATAPRLGEISAWCAGSAPWASLPPALVR
jgi:hypothetical protein